MGRTLLKSIGAGLLCVCLGAVGIGCGSHSGAGAVSTGKTIETIACSLFFPFCSSTALVGGGTTPESAFRCSNSPAEITGGGSLVSAMLLDDPVESGVITSVRVSTVISHDSPHDLTVTLTSPSGTSMTLFAGSPSEPDLNRLDPDLYVLWSDAGLDFGSQPLACQCEMAPLEDLGRLSGESPIGVWELEVSSPGLPTTLEEWCLEINGSNVADQ